MCVSGVPQMEVGAQPLGDMGPNLMEVGIQGAQDEKFVVAPQQTQWGAMSFCNVMGGFVLGWTVLIVSFYTLKDDDKGSVPNNNANQATVRQEVAFTSIASVALYAGDLKTCIETGYAVSIGIMNGTTYLEAHSLTSTSTAARRAGVQVTFVATVPISAMTAVQTLATGLALNKTSLVAAILQAPTLHICSP